ncbi:hypothetical protein D5S18_08630 [Nocardia panacis]|uniref:Uncharacterized protein n=1 Tax=Nocardia panacis TaxID=2340916 RepID=A0A3A4JYK3_9NOCA|nr:hypothetical protein D5S18_08630 [Nocardia panacis]
MPFILGMQTVTFGWAHGREGFLASLFLSGVLVRFGVEQRPDVLEREPVAVARACCASLCGSSGSVALGFRAE